MPRTAEDRLNALPPAVRAVMRPATALLAAVVIAVVVALAAGSVGGGLVAGVVVGAVVLAVGQAARRRAGIDRPAVQQLSPADELRATQGDVRRLQPGDVVNWELIDFVVERTMTFDEDGFQWQEHHLVDVGSGRRVWLSVEDDDGLEVGVYERVDGAELAPDDAELTHDGVTYRRQERGRARFTTRDESGPGQSGTVEYADYRAGAQRLSLERYGAETWEVSVGRVVSEHELDIYGKGRA